MVQKKEINDDARSLLYTGERKEREGRGLVIIEVCNNLKTR